MTEPSLLRVRHSRVEASLKLSSCASAKSAGGCFLWLLGLVAGVFGCGDEASEPSLAPCAPGFASSVVSTSYGDGAGFGQASMPDIVLGPPSGGGSLKGSVDVVSLGLGGEIVLAFEPAIGDGPGADLIVFENAFLAGGDPNNVFAEPGEVSVSQDAESWLTFVCDPQQPAGCAGVSPVFATTASEALDEDGAGGDAFDLQSVGLDQARYVRIRDVGGKRTPNGTSGFDLDAVANLHPVCP